MKIHPSLYLFGGMGALTLLLSATKSKAAPRPTKAPRSSDRTGLTFGVGDRVAVAPVGIAALIPAAYEVFGTIVAFPPDIPSWDSLPVTVKLDSGETTTVEIDRLSHAP